MNRLIYFLIALLALGCTFSCKRQKTTVRIEADTDVAAANSESHLEYLPFQDSTKSRKWGLIGIDGKALFTDSLDNEPSNAVGGLFVIKENGYYHYYIATEKPQRVGGDYTAAGLFYADVAPCVESGKGYIQFIKKDGTVAFELKEINGERVEWVSRFNDGLARVKAGGKIGFINTDGEVVIEPRFISATPFSDGVALVVENDGENAQNYQQHKPYKINVVGTDGVLKDATFMSDEKIGKRGFQNGLIAHTFKTDSDSIASEFLNFSGQAIIPATVKYKEVTDMFGTRFGYYDGKSWGVADNQLTMLIEPKLDEVLYLTDEVIAAKEYGRYKLLDYSGRNVSKLYETMRCLDNGETYLVKGETGYTIINDKGMEMSPMREKISWNHLQDTIYAGKWTEQPKPKVKENPAPVAQPQPVAQPVEPKPAPKAQPKPEVKRNVPEVKQQTKATSGSGKTTTNTQKPAASQSSQKKRTQQSSSTNASQRNSSQKLKQQPKPRPIRARDDTIIHL